MEVGFGLERDFERGDLSLNVEDLGVMEEVDG